MPYDADVANYVHTAAGSSDVALVTGEGRLYGFTARETASAVASFILRDGVDVTGTPILFVNLLAGETVGDTLGDIQGVEFDNGLFLDRTGGSTEITVFI